mmetsp:Transcript_7555/g.9882  ORF Transcript_7555/g.9882 Transcript_7555/m.9882 type:complete len:91 (+) Transcript_7555:1195-1467(+)
MDDDDVEPSSSADCELLLLISCCLWMFGNGLATALVAALALKAKDENPSTASLVPVIIRIPRNKVCDETKNARFMLYRLLVQLGTTLFLR